MTRPEAAHGLTLTIRLLPTKSPAAIKEIMRTVLLSSNAIMTLPLPTATVIDLDSSAIEIELAFRVSSLGQASAARTEIFDLVYRHTKAAGLELAAPKGTAGGGVDEVPAMEWTRTHPGTAWRLLSSISLFATLTQDEKTALASDMKRLTFRKDTLMASQDTSLTSLMIMRTGVAVIERPGRQDAGEVTRLAPGDILGVRGILMGALELGDIRAMTFVVVYEISKDRLSAVMHDRPALADELGVLLSKSTDANGICQKTSKKPSSRHH